MTTATRSVAVVAARLPNIDRRVLSQAWYSALHLTQAQPGAAAARPTSPAPPAAVAAPRNARLGLPVRVAAPAPVRGVICLQVRPVAPACAERRAPVTELSRRIEAVLVRHVANAPVRPATLALKAGDGRVQLLVRNDGSATRVVALCAPHLRERVDRALAHARFALAATGTRIEAAAV
jgi:hypothetical protein